jgi:hypothetical protein
MDKDQDKGLNRREFIRKAAITGAVAWAVPAIQTVAATPAFAQTSGSACVHSPIAAGNPNCKDACGSVGMAECGKDCGGGCEAICGDCISGGGNVCPSPDYCNPACFDITSCAGSCTVSFLC